MMQKITEGVLSILLEIRDPDQVINLQQTSTFVFIPRKQLKQIVLSKTQQM